MVRRPKGLERVDRADHNFTIGSIALMIFMVIAGFTAWIFGLRFLARSGSTGSSQALPQSDQRVRAAQCRHITTDVPDDAAARMRRNPACGTRTLPLHCGISIRPMAAWGQHETSRRMGRPVYLQQRTYLMIVAAAVECQLRTSTGAVFPCGLSRSRLGPTITRRFCSVSFSCRSRALAVA